MAESSRKHGYYVLTIMQDECETNEDTVARALQYHVDGVVIMSITIENSESMVSMCKRSGTAVVLMNRYIPGSDIESVCCDNYAAGEMIIKYLHNRGHKTIACLMGSALASTTQERLKGIQYQSQKVGISISDVIYGSYTYESGKEMGRELITKSLTLPDTIFCCGDIIAFGVIDVLRYEFKLKVPEDISVMGFDDIREASWQAYNLTTVHQPYDDLVNSTFELLIRRIKSPDSPIARMLHDTNIVERGSVK